MMENRLANTPTRDTTLRDTRSLPEFRSALPFIPVKLAILNKSPIPSTRKPVLGTMMITFPNMDTNEVRVGRMKTPKTNRATTTNTIKTIMRMMPTFSPMMIFTIITMPIIMPEMIISTETY